jgi:hypothetical protein
VPTRGSSLDHTTGPIVDDAMRLDERLRLLLNFGAHRMSDCIRRTVNRYEPASAQDPSAALR